LKAVDEIKDLSEYLTEMLLNLMCIV